MTCGGSGVCTGALLELYSPTPGVNRKSLSRMELAAPPPAAASVGCFDAVVGVGADEERDDFGCESDTAAVGF